MLLLLFSLIFSSMFHGHMPSGRIPTLRETNGGIFLHCGAPPGNEDDKN